MARSFSSLNSIASVISRMKALKFIFDRNNLLIAFSVVATLSIGYLGYDDFRFQEKTKVLQSDLEKTQFELLQAQNELAYTKTERDGLHQDLVNKTLEVNDLGNQVQTISGQVGTIVKLSKIDPELLQKYSKIYFLNENYVPTGLLPIDPTYTLNASGEKLIHQGVAPFLRDLLESANQAGINLRVASSYRSFGAQAQLKSSYIFVYGSGANKFSAEQGYSEHQLGTTVDFTTQEIGGSFNGFDKSTAYTWLRDNAYRFGFALSYPQGNGYYVFEPWHWRFVGRVLAKKLHDDGKYFYDLDQRDIDTYLISFFD